MLSEEVLVRRARLGDRAAFEELIRRSTRLVYAQLYLETGDAQLVEDLVQETFLRAYRSITQLQDPTGFRSWLLTVAVNVAADQKRYAGRQKRKAPPRKSQEKLAETPAPAAEAPERKEARERIRQLLLTLPEEYRLPLTLHYINGHDYETITVQLGLSNGSVRGLLHRGLKLLRAALESEAYLP